MRSVSLLNYEKRKGGGSRKGGYFLTSLSRTPVSVRSCEKHNTNAVVSNHPNIEGEDARAGG